MGRLLHADKLANLHPMLRAAATQIADAMPDGISVSEGERSLARSDELYAQGRTKPGPIVSNARAGQSPHNYRLAFDAYPLDPDGRWAADDSSLWEAYGEAVKAVPGMVWGGDFHSLRDTPHVELAGWQSSKEWDASIAEVSAGPETAGAGAGGTESVILFCVAVIGAIAAFVAVRALA